MSVVCARVYKDKIVMAADSIVVKWGENKDISGNFLKMRRINDVLIGSSGGATEASLMWHYMATHNPFGSTEKDVLEYMVEFSRWKKELTGDGKVENQYLIAFGGKLFCVYGIFVTEVKEFESIGHGMFYANAVMHMGHSPREAVKVACDMDCFVAEPIIEETMPR